MNRVSTLVVLGGVIFLSGLVGCKTEVNNPPAQNTVIREDRPRDSAADKVNVNVHEHDHTPDNPSVQNNVKVER
jgi:hypothetical protein